MSLPYPDHYRPPRKPSRLAKHLKMAQNGEDEDGDNIVVKMYTPPPMSTSTSTGQWEDTSFAFSPLVGKGEQASSTAHEDADACVRFAQEAVSLLRHTPLKSCSDKAVAELTMACEQIVVVLADGVAAINGKRRQSSPRAALVVVRDSLRFTVGVVAGFITALVVVVFWFLWESEGHRGISAY